MTRQSEQNDVLFDFSDRLERLGIEYMLTGSMALSHYAQPRTTADIDIVLAISMQHVTRFEEEFGKDFYIPDGRVADAVMRRRMFNVLDQRTIVKIDCVVRKETEFAKAAFARRKRVHYARSFEVWIITKEDLILSKLDWAKESRSEMQMRDVASLIRNPFDEVYVKDWATRLGVTDLLDDCYQLLEKNL